MPQDQTRRGQGCRDLGDDESIPDDAVLWRRINQFDPDGKRPSTGNFRDSSGELSVCLASLTDRDSALAGYAHFRLAAFSAGEVRQFGKPSEYIIRHDPTEGDPSHALICPKLTKSAAKKLSQLCAWA